MAPGGIGIALGHAHEYVGMVPRERGVLKHTLHGGVVLEVLVMGRSGIGQ